MRLSGIMNGLIVAAACTALAGCGNFNVGPLVKEIDVTENLRLDWHACGGLVLKRDLPLLDEDNYWRVRPLGCPK